MVSSNVYNTSYNCRFPRAIREEGFFYEISDTDLSLVSTKDTPYYIVKGSNIKIIRPDDYSILNLLKIYLYMK